MINAIIFSKDRAAQLELLLDSMVENCPGVFNINILYTSSNDDFAKGYKELKDITRKFGTEDEFHFNWVEETGDFKKDLMGMFDANYEYTCFFTDDDIFYQPIKEEEIVRFMEDEDVFCFSLRLGKNTMFCYTMNKDNKLHNEEIIEDRFMKWEWVKHYLDFGYPLSVDGHVFRTNEIKKLTGKVSFENPNTYEAGLQMFDYFPREFMVSYKTNRLVNSPTNVVQTVFPNRKGEEFSYTAQELNENYLNGKKIDYKSIDFSDIKGCHQELRFDFIDEPRDTFNLIKRLEEQYKKHGIGPYKTEKNEQQN
jgi:hypothetical protein